MPLSKTWVINMPLSNSRIISMPLSYSRINNTPLSNSRINQCFKKMKCLLLNSVLTSEFASRVTFGLR